MTSDQMKTGSAVLSAVVIPVLLAWLGQTYTQAQKERDVQAQFVKIAVDILQSPPTPDNRNVRDWATQIINRYSGVPLTAEAKRDLIDSVPISALEFGLKVAGKLPQSDLAQTQTELGLLGLYQGPVNGLADDATVKAIIAFQKSRGIISDGALGPQTRTMIHRAAQDAQSKP